MNLRRPTVIFGNPEVEICLGWESFGGSSSESPKPLKILVTEDAVTMPVWNPTETAHGNVAVSKTLENPRLKSYRMCCRTCSTGPVSSVIVAFVWKQTSHSPSPADTPCLSRSTDDFLVMFQLLWSRAHVPGYVETLTSMCTWAGESSKSGESILMIATYTSPENPVNRPKSKHVEKSAVQKTRTSLLLCLQSGEALDRAWICMITSTMLHYANINK